MTPLQTLTRKMLELEQILDEDYETYKLLLDAVETLEYSLKIVDAHRKLSLGDGDITAMNIRRVLGRLNGQEE